MSEQTFGEVLEMAKPTYQIHSDGDLVESALGQDQADSILVRSGNIFHFVRKSKLIDLKPKRLLRDYTNQFSTPIILSTQSPAEEAGRQVADFLRQQQERTFVPAVIQDDKGSPRVILTFGLTASGTIGIGGVSPNLTFSTDPPEQDDSGPPKQYVCPGLPHVVEDREIAAPPRPEGQVCPVHNIPMERRREPNG